MKSSKKAKVCSICRMERSTKRSRLLYSRYTCPCDIDVTIIDEEHYNADNVAQKDNIIKPTFPVSEDENDDVIAGCGVVSLLVKPNKQDLEKTRPEICCNLSRKSRNNMEGTRRNVRPERSIAGNTNNNGFVPAPLLKNSLECPARHQADCINHLSFGSTSDYLNAREQQPEPVSPGLNYRSILSPEVKDINPEVPNKGENDKMLDFTTNNMGQCTPGLHNIDLSAACNHHTSRGKPLTGGTLRANVRPPRLSVTRHRHFKRYKPQRVNQGNTCVKRAQQRKSKYPKLKSSYLVSLASGGLVWKPTLIRPLLLSKKDRAGLLCRPAKGIMKGGYEMFFSNTTRQDKASVEEGNTEIGDENFKYIQDVSASFGRKNENSNKQCHNKSPENIPTKEYPASNMNKCSQTKQCDDHLMSKPCDRFGEATYAELLEDNNMNICENYEVSSGADDAWNTWCNLGTRYQGNVESQRKPAAPCPGHRPLSMILWEQNALLHHRGGPTSYASNRPYPEIVERGEHSEVKTYSNQDHPQSAQYVVSSRVFEVSIESTDTEIDNIQTQRFQGNQFQEVTTHVSSNTANDIAKKYEDHCSLKSSSSLEVLLGSPPPSTDLSEFHFRFNPPITVMELGEQNNSNEAGSIFRANGAGSGRGHGGSEDQYSGRVVKVEGDGRCMFRSLATGQSVTLQMALRDELGRPVRREEEEKEKVAADDMRSRVVELMRDNLHFYSQLEGGVINADQPRPQSYQRFFDRLQAMAKPATMPGDLELNAVAMVLERPILVLSSDLQKITIYGQERFPQRPVLAVRYTRLVADVGHYDAVILDDESQWDFVFRSPSPTHMQMRNQSLTQWTCRDFQKLSLGDGDNGATKITSKAKSATVKAKPPTPKGPNMSGKREHSRNFGDILVCVKDSNHSHTAVSKSRSGKDGSERHGAVNFVSKDSTAQGEDRGVRPKHSDVAKSGDKICQRSHEKSESKTAEKSGQSKHGDKSKHVLIASREKRSVQRAARSDDVHDKKAAQVPAKSSHFPGKYPSTGIKEFTNNHGSEKDSNERDDSGIRYKVRVDGVEPKAIEKTKKDNNISSGVPSQDILDHHTRERSILRAKRMDKRQGRKSKTATCEHCRRERKKVNSDKNDNRKHTTRKRRHDEQEDSSTERPDRNPKRVCFSQRNIHTRARRCRSRKTCKSSSRRSRLAVKSKENTRRLRACRSKGKTSVRLKRKKNIRKSRTRARSMSSHVLGLSLGQKSEVSCILPGRVPDISGAAQVICFLCGQKVVTGTRNMLQCYLCGRMAHRTCAVQESSCWANTDSGDLYFLCANCVH